MMILQSMSYLPKLFRQYEKYSFLWLAKTTLTCCFMLYVEMLLTNPSKTGKGNNRVVGFRNITFEMSLKTNPIV